MLPQAKASNEATMASTIIDRIRREQAGTELFEALAERLNPSDLQSLLLEVYRVRAAQQTPAGLLAQYQCNRFAQPSAVDPRLLLEFDRLAFALAAPLFQPIELAPVSPLGTTSAVAPVDQNSAVATIRNTELVSDSTNVLALECALRRRGLSHDPAQTHAPVRLCASQRLLRAQHYDRPGALAHFRLFALCTAGRDSGSYRFESEALLEQIGVYVRLLLGLIERGYAMRDLRIGLTDFAAGKHQAALQAGVIAPLAAQFPNVAAGFDPDRTSGRDYYDAVCFYIYITDNAGAEHTLVDGGFTSWTQQILNNKKERLLISGIGTERVCSLFGKEEYS
jgi:hypothetical protein